MNKLIAQALSAASQRNVLIIDLDPEKLKERFVSDYGVNEKQVKVWQKPAEEFLRKDLSLTFLAGYLPISEESPF